MMMTDNGDSRQCGLDEAVVVFGDSFVHTGD